MKLQLTLVYILFSQLGEAQLINFYKIPEQQFNFEEAIGLEESEEDTEFESFEISNQISVGQYQLYLESIKFDSTNNFYLSQFPDSTILPEEKYTQYLSDSRFTNLPIMGISWENAMNFCIWKTRTEHIDDTIDYYYRIPLLDEWVSAKYYHNSNKAKFRPLKGFEIDKKYSDWLLNSKDESMQEFSDKSMGVNYVYFARQTDPLAMKRKMIIGNSYHFEIPSVKEQMLLNFYQNEGYKHVGFRIIRIRRDAIGNRKTYSNHSLTHKNINLKSNHQSILVEDLNITSNFEKGQFKGRYISTYLNGNTKVKGRFKNNQRIGPWYFYSKTGNLITARFYFDNFRFRTLFPNIEEDEYIRLQNKEIQEFGKNADGFIGYFYISERMVLWSKRIWREISLVNNPELFNDYPEIVDFFIDMIKLNHLTAYNSNSDQFKTELTSKDIANIEDETFELTGFKIKEDCFFDNERLISESRIIGLAPYSIDESGNEKILFWLYYPELRNSLANLELSISGIKRINSMDDLFFYRYFYSKITKVSNLTEEMTDEKDVYLEEIIIKEAEHDLIIKLHR